MRGWIALLSATLLATPALLSQASRSIDQWSSMNAERQRELNSLGQPAKSANQQASATAPWTSLAGEEGDDPTLSAVVSTEEPPRAARKAAGNAEHLAKKGSHDEAIAEYRRALEIDPQYYEAENNLALELEAAGKREEAEKTFPHLMQTAPAHVLAFNNLGILLCAEGRYADAEAVARGALKAQEYSFRSSYLLGSALVDQGKWTDEAKTKLAYASVKYPQAKELLAKWPAQAHPSN